MKSTYQARWVSKPRAESLRKTATAANAVLLDSFNGFIVVEPVGSNLGDGKVLSRREADYELQQVWIQEPKTKLLHARKLLGLEAEQLAGAGAG